MHTTFWYFGVMASDMPRSESASMYLPMEGTSGQPDAMLGGVESDTPENVRVEGGARVWTEPLGMPERPPSSAHAAARQMAAVRSALERAWGCATGARGGRLSVCEWGVD